MYAGKIGNRALGVSLTVSFAFLVVFTAILFFIDYKRERDALENEIQDLCEIQTPGIVEGLINHDNRLLRAMTDGLVLHRYIRYAAIETDSIVVSESGDQENPSAVKRFRLSEKETEGIGRTLGWLRVEADTARILSDAADRISMLIAFQVLFLMVVYLVVPYYFSKIVTRHLTVIADYVREFGARPDTPDLTLDKRDYGDELDTLVRSFNTMRTDLRSSLEAEARAMEDLRLSEEMNRILVEEAPDAILMMDYETMRFVSCNRKAEELFRRPRAEIIFSEPQTLYAPIQPDGLPLGESVTNASKRATAGETVLIRRTILRPDGETLTCETRICPLPAVGRTILRVSYLDITDRVRAENEAARSLREKEVLLQEVYHRTKNNMQLIAAFLSMESVTSEDKHVVGILENMIGRITAMALVHQKLYKSQDLSRIDLGEYLKDLVMEIQLAYLSKRPDVKIEVKAQKGIISILDTAIPCGLAINELIINSVKHAYPENRAGVIHVELSKRDSETLTFNVSDDGVGFPVGFDFRKDGKIGIQTAISLIEGQLHGNISFGPGPGVFCTAVFQANLYQPRV